MSSGEHRPISGASLGLGPVENQEATPFDVPEAGRYVSGGLLGRGGMGEVRAAHDLRLGRQVAIKTALANQAGRKLVEEASLTARLVHPNIVPVHDAGRDAEGRPYYAMPIVRGRSLAEAAAGAPMSERLRLVRHFLDACEAVAYAHSEGLLHRDLKPANILVGRFGETLVVDWGLAGPIGERPVGARGGPVGTPGFMSPEQANGVALTPTADVYALGATLYTLLAGVAPSPGARLRVVCPEVPAELAAIAERALQPAPEDRYPEARALADDVVAWFEGRRVAAHRYTFWELLRRVWAAWRVPIAALALALVGIAVATAVGWSRTVAERDRSRTAEQVANDARARSDHHFALAQVAQALDASTRGEQAEAEIFAASALTLEPSPDARGVLARFDERARPRRLKQLELPDCIRLAIGPEGRHMACATDGVVQVFDLDRGQAELLRIEATPDALGMSKAGLLLNIAGVGMTLYPLNGDAPRDLGLRREPIFITNEAQNRLVWLAGGVMWSAGLDGHVRRSGACVDGRWGGVEAAAQAPSGHVVVGCYDGLVLLEAPDGAQRTLARLGVAQGPPISAAIHTDAAGVARVALGFSKGDVVVLDARTGRVERSFHLDSDVPYGLALDGTRIAVATSRRDVWVWNLESGTQIARLPGLQSQIRWRDDGSLRVVGRAAEDWSLPTLSPWPHQHPSNAGVASLSVSPDGQHFVSGHGDGVLRIRRLDGTAERELQLHSTVVKDVAFSPDGRWVAAVCAGEPIIHLLDVYDPTVHKTLTSANSRRVVWLNGLLAAAPYNGGLWGWTDLEKDPVKIQINGRVLDMEPSPDGQLAWLLDAAGRAWRLEPGPRLLAVESSLVAEGISGTADRRISMAGNRLEVRDLEPSGDWVRALVTEGVPPMEVLIAPDGETLVSGHRDGTISIWSAVTLERLAVLRGHTGKIPALAMDPSGRWLLSGSWDGDVRVWSLGSLTASPAALRQAAELAWGRTVEGLLGGESQSSPNLILP